MVRETLKAIWAIIICVLLPIEVNGKENTMTGIFNEDFRTIVTEVNGDRMSPPVIGINSNETLTIGFDALREERDYLRYSIYHCDADWSLSDVADTEVFDGFNYADITDYAFSRATAVHYIHYSVTLPNEEFSFRLSGNYILRVYPENDPDDILLQVRFMVTEGSVAIRGEASSRTDTDYNERHQQLTLDVDLNKYPVRDPFNDLTLVVTQNGRHDNEVTVRHPARVSGNSAIYEHLKELIFPGGNEYRRMETVQQTYPGMGVEEIAFHDPYYHHILKMAEPRHSKPYYFDQTQHGRYFVREYNSSNSDTEADYCVVHFTLKMLPVMDGDVYIDGDLTYRHFDDSSQMKYDDEAGVYHKALLLKQGAYNYQYLTVPRSGDGTARTADVEGDFHQTVNEYEVKVYYRAPGERYDRLLGVTLIYSGR